MVRDDLRNWVRELQRALEELATQDFDYSLGTNEVREPASSLPRLPRDLEPLYTVSDGVSLPDVHVGYFIDPAQRVASAAERGEPTRMAGRPPLDVHVFGTDGGGGRFALRLDDGSMYYLPASGVVKDGVFYEDKAAVPVRLAETMIDFLWLLLADVDAFVDDQQDHIYMAR